MKYTDDKLQQGQAVVYRLRLRQGETVLETSAELKAQAPNRNDSSLEADLSGVFLVCTFDSYRDSIATGTFRTDLTFTDPVVRALVTEAVQGLETQDFEITNGRVTDIVPDEANVCVITVEPTTLGQPISIRLPSNNVHGVGEGITANGRYYCTRSDSASNSLVVETS